MPASHPNPASPWVYDTRLLDRQPGSLKTFTGTLTAADPMGIEVLAVPAGEPITLNLRFESVIEGVLVSGTVFSRAVGECARCLIEIERPVGADIRELYVYPHSTTAQTMEPDELPILEDSMIDLEQLVRDEIVVQMPLAPLCRPDCLGLCPTCGGRLDDLEPGHTHEILDPRWAALRSQSGSRTSPSKPPKAARPERRRDLQNHTEE